MRVLRFSPNDKWLLSGGEDEAVHVHPVNPNLVLEIGCSVAGRPMSDTEAERVGLQAAAGVCRPRTEKNPVLTHERMLPGRSLLEAVGKSGLP